MDNPLWTTNSMDKLLEQSRTVSTPGVVHIQRDRRERGSKESISSSWSSLFNVPGTSSGTVSIRPNSVAVSNLSSSGSQHDYAAKVAFIGNKYKNNKNS